MTRRLPLGLLALSSAAALALALSACAPDDATPTPSNSSARPTPSASASASASPTPTAGAEACLPGTWKMDQSALDRYYGDVNSALAGAGVTFTPAGSATLVMGADGSYSWMPVVQLDADVSGTTIAVSIGGNLDGTYTVAGNLITTTTTSTDGLQVAATIDGVPTDAGAVTEQIAAAPITNATYTCAGDTLTLATDIGGATATSVLTRG